MSNSLKVTVSACLLALSIGCAPSSQLIRRFVDADEMVKLFPKMPKRNVLANLGQPIEVRAGLVTATGEVYEIWLYAVSEKQVEVIGRRVKTGGNTGVTQWGPEKIFALTFKNDQLVKWGYEDDDWEDFSKEDGEIRTPDSKQEEPTKKK